MAFRSADGTCVSCRCPLTEVIGDGYRVARCPECGGALVRTSDLAIMFARVQPRRTLELVVHNDGRPRHGCPVCSTKMDITFIEFLRLESCEQHGVWFGSGQIEKLFAYDVRLELPSFRR